MKKRVRIIIGLFYLFFASQLFASHHFETALSKKYPQYDLTDLYVFDSDREGFTSFIISINPRTMDDPIKSFGQNGIYNIHIGDNNNIKENKGITITAKADSTKMLFGLANKFDPELGTTGSKLGLANIDEITDLNSDIRVWFGIARDIFVGNSKGLRGFRKQVASGDRKQPIMDNFIAGEDYFARLKSSIIVVEISNDLLPSKISVFASSVMQIEDKWLQVNRMANPLMTHLFMFADPDAVSEHVSHRFVDSDKMMMKSAITNTINQIMKADTKAPKNKKEHINHILQLWTPDLISYKVGSKANFSKGDMNGRSPTDDAMDVVLSIALGRDVIDNASTFDRHPLIFPYVEYVKK